MADVELSQEATATNDEADLKAMGYSQELFRSLGGFSNFAVSFSIISILTGAVTLYGHGLIHGGPLVMSFGWILVTLLVLPVAASLAELASAFPTAGALYHWSSFLGNKHWGWFTAMFNLIGQFAITAGIGYGLADFLMPLLGLADVPNFTTLRLVVYAVILLSHALLNHFGIGLVGILNDLSAWYHMAGVAVLLVALGFFAPHQSVDFLWSTQHTADFPYWYAFPVALLQAAWTYTGYDASAHVSEETKNPRLIAPWGIFLSVAVSGIFGWLLLLVVTMSIQDLSLAQAASNPFIHILSTALGHKMGFALTWVCAIAMWFCGLASVTSNSRMIYAFSRDHGMPLSRFWARVSPRFKTPAQAIWLSAAAAFLLGVYGQVYSVIVSISTIALYISYGLPIFIGLRARKSGVWTVRGPWHLGKHSGWINCLSLFWVVVMCVLFVIPPNQLTGYTIGGLSIFLVLLYQYGGIRKRYDGPPKSHLD
ncbi:MAG: amino acid permease [Bdellovibrio sp.]|nr:amino acid permease [Bdellovibrio sp.]